MSDRSGHKHLYSPYRTIAEVLWSSRDAVFDSRRGVWVGEAVVHSGERQRAQTSATRSPSWRATQTRLGDSPPLKALLTTINPPSP
ncbi:hypothetical protein L6R49_05685 [Myxococcota bacterium]|nr:hypothetical protein [Myxococcota bacterium]